MLLIVEKGNKGIEEYGEIKKYAILFIDMRKLITNTWDSRIKTKNHLKYCIILSTILSIGT